ncbi:hypothetical protein [Iamia sp.]|uniref:hypothetical protein n=1 Tax=Iamia sp. TaxID=2722710 RepID=UPI002CAE21F5|nr:hypothetical protein [Iamia sp.]HXH59084.1 hypothetical protein [Iamia sp.]
MTTNEAMSEAMVAGQRWLQYGASSGPTGEVRHLRVVPDPAVSDEWWAELRSIEQHLELLEADLFALECRVRRLRTEAAGLPAAG